MSATPRARVLCIDDDAGVVAWLVEELCDAGLGACGATDPLAALARAVAEDFDVIVSDVEMPGLRGIDLVARLRVQAPRTMCILITGFGSIDLAVAAMQAGAVDFVAKPFAIEVLIRAIERAVGDRVLRSEIKRLRRRLAGPGPSELVAESAAMRQVLDVAARAARSHVPVLLQGESGVGKGEVARWLHARSPRASRPFVALNCAALPTTLLEAELFGVRRGAYTDAREDRDGLFQAADGGTLFLDEIGELPVEAQAKLLTALETGRVRPLGGAAEVQVDVRIVTATNRDLPALCQAQRFRDDLYWRLAVVRLVLPPLRERPEDIEALVDVFVERAALRAGREVLGVDTAARAALLSARWPGNVRELHNTIERAVALCDGEVLRLVDLDPFGELRPRPALRHEAKVMVEGAPDAVALGQLLAKRWTLAELEDAYVRQALSALDGNKSEAARLLGIDRRTLYRKLASEGEG